VYRESGNLSTFREPPRADISRGRHRHRLSLRTFFRSSSSKRHVQSQVDGTGSAEVLLPPERSIPSGDVITEGSERTSSLSDDVAARRISADGATSLFGPHLDQSTKARYVPLPRYHWLGDEWSFSRADVGRQGCRSAPKSSD
jgi:hypothetical protein